MSAIMYIIEKNTLEYVKHEDVITELYLLKIRVPTEKNVIEYTKRYKTSGVGDVSIIDFFGSNIRYGIKKIKKELSKIDNKIPLYDIYTENLYLVDRKYIYDKVMTESYRFPKKELLETLKTRRDTIQHDIKELSKYTSEIENNVAKGESLDMITNETFDKFQEKKLLIIALNKINMGLDFMDSFDLKILYNTYVNALYTYSSKLGKNLTLCKRPSFAYQFKHITPYYTRAEIINMALNMGIIKDDIRYVDDTVNSLCNVIRDNDINSKIILDHQIHIIRNKMIGLVQYYSMWGSYEMNRYLREQVSYEYKNEYLEEQIRSMWKLILSAPSFDKQYIVYRLVHTDSFISNVKIGDIYTEKGFMSTTRDPFYQTDSYKFGWIMLKIKLPARKIGCALCIESVSLFQKEDELILPPNTQFKLLRKNDSSIYYHTDPQVSKRVRTTYELEVVGNLPIEFIERPIYKELQPPIDFLQIPKIEAITIDEKIHVFENKYVNCMGQFTALIGNKNFVIKSEWYDSTSIYEKYYAASTKNGYSLFAIFNNHIIFVIELGSDKFVPYMYVNYHIKHTSIEREHIIDSESFVTFIASIAYFFDVPSVVLYADYISCDYMIPVKDTNDYTHFYGGTFCVDFYEYVKNGTKRYASNGIMNVELIPKFRYHQLDVLKKILPDDIIEKRNERTTDDRVYKVYKNMYKPITPEINNNMANFFVWIIEKNCHMYTELVDKFTKIPQYAVDNPFKNDYYIFNAMAYLYNKGKISYIPQIINNINIDNMTAKTKNEMGSRYRNAEKQRTR